MDRENPHFQPLQKQAIFEINTFWDGDPSTFAIGIPSGLLLGREAAQSNYGLLLPLRSK